MTNAFPRPRLLAFMLGFVLATSVSCSTSAQPPVVKVERGELVQSFPHDPEAFTQGLTFHNGILYEGTGQKGKSSLRKVSIDDGKVLEQVNLDPLYFGEGITILGDSIYQLTWKENTCFVYDLKTFQYKKHFQYIFEGWGLTNNGEDLILSDGSALLRFLDPETFQEKKKIQVTDRNRRIKSLNELEWVEGEIWANIWYEDRIARISPEDGRVLGWIDLSHIYPMRQRHREAVMNGIAYDPETKRLFITGKNWPKLFEIKVPGFE